ncbi:MAG TPA: metal-dependent phosphohydrolase [Acetivibrio sp.]|uniref:metal-dependent phosphohydrolase n=1 Tax=Acetivibrio sp. TaxID=1872092 RepID=UPI002BB1F8AB|nr:metal-dependent phosphohydrolase [Acetivibrio sp.]HOM01974.1 metal-dependent phosphohydrolase [Acetivibrio sp.]
MLLKKKFDESYNNRQIGRIRKDLIANLRKMGVEVSNIQIDLDENNVSLRLSIPEKRYSSIPSE